MSIHDFSWERLHTVDFSFNSPFSLTLADGSKLKINEVIRVMPGKRLVGFAEWNNEQVVAKLFFDVKHGSRHVKTDSQGIALLKERKVPTPTLLFQGEAADSRIKVLLFEKLVDAVNLDLCWEQKKNIEEVMPQLKAVVVELATQHVTGVIQHDLHMKNFMLTEKVIYTLDGGQVEGFLHMLDKKQSMENLALFLSQLGMGVEDYQEALFRHYAHARGWRLKDQDVKEMFLQIRKWNDERWRKFDKKLTRDSTHFKKIKNWHSMGVFERANLGFEMLKFIQDPESAFRHASSVMLKNGRSSTVIKVKLDHKDYVIKRYNLKNVWHRLRRSLRSTRAFHSWRLSHKLGLFGLPTAKPVGFLEQSILGLKGKSYFIMEYVPGEHAGEFFAHTKDPQTQETVINSIISLLRNLRKLEITHGDLKITNILINKKNQPLLIDLDGAAEHRSIAGLNHAWHKEIKRFLQNFRDVGALQTKFEEGLRF